MNDTKAVSTPSADETEHCRSRVLETATDRSVRSSIGCVSLKSDWSKFDPPFFSDKRPEDPTAAALQTRADLRVLDHTCLKSHDSGEDVEDVEDVEEEEVGEKEEVGEEEDQSLMKLGSCGNLESYRRKLKRSLKQSYEPQMSRPYVKQQVYQAEDTSKESTFEVTEGFKTRPDQSNSKVFITILGRSTFKGSPKDIEEVFRSRPGLSPPHFILTLGVAGAGKSSLVRSVVLDWCEDRCLQDVHLLVPLTFSRLNQLRNQSCSLLQLLWSFCPGLKESRLTDVSQLRILFILDGLDECRLPLDFTPHAPPKADLHTLMPVPTLLVSLLEGALLPEAQVWVTSRPPAASLPASLVHSVTELHGFSPRQQEELSDSQQEELSNSQQEEELSDSQQEEELSDSQQEEELSDSQQEELSDSQQEELSDSQQEEELSDSQQEEELSDAQQEEHSDSQQQEELSDSQQQEELSHSQQEEELSDSQQQEELSDSQQEELSDSQQEELSDSQQQGLSRLPLIHSIAARLSKERGSRPTQTQTLVHLLSYLMMKMQHSYSLTQSRVHEIVLSLSTLASQLKGPDSQHNREGLGQHTFCEEHLKRFGVSQLEALVWSGLCVEVDSGRSGPCCCECGRKAPLYEFVDESLRRFLSTLSSRLSQDKGPNSSKKLLQCLREMDQEETRRSTDLTLTSPWPQRVTALSSWNYKNP
ncbi:unnamed protein product [Knipowitschia caucasica]|uniref:NACHT domain-containing protein n=1 Tax=Knipowitschia caucasica TaxID=637954 RepID=A0AAV2MGE5_KNICA